jgi:hypothetical protein
MIKNCTNCGAKLHSGEQFCSKFNIKEISTLKPEPYTGNNKAGEIGVEGLIFIYSELSLLV